MTDDILNLCSWIKETGCQVAAMESTDVYWKPVYNILESEGIETIVVNAQHIKAVSGRKTYVKDAEWIADLVRHGLVKASYVPNHEQRELREMVHCRNEIVNERARELNSIQCRTHFNSHPCGRGDEHAEQIVKAIELFQFSPLREG